jgi:hypothetical protein
MKKFLTLAAIAIFFACTAAPASAASYTTGANNVISIDPLDLLISGRINATFEHKMSAKNSLTINASYYSFSDWWSAIGVGASYRWYVDPFEEGKSALNGLSLGPRVQYFSWNWDGPDYGYGDWGNYSSFSIGVEVAYKWTFSSKWVIEPIFKYTFPVMKKDYGFTPDDWGLGVNLGYAF